MFKTLHVKKLILSFLIPFGVAFLSEILTKNAMEEYANLASPPLSPPGVVFPIVWAVLYFLMSLSLYGIANSTAPQPKKSLCYLIFGLQLFFNFAWTILFFVFGLHTFSAVWLTILIALIILNILAFYRISKASAYMLIPYLLWCIFALYLNIGIAILN